MKILLVDDKQENLLALSSALESLGEELVLGLGSVGEILDGKFPWNSAPLVMANILAPVIIRLFDAGLAELVEPGGVIILSGILQEQAQECLPNITKTDQHNLVVGHNCLITVAKERSVRQDPALGSDEWIVNLRSGVPGL